MPKLKESESIETIKTAAFTSSTTSTIGSCLIIGKQKAHFLIKRTPLWFRVQDQTVWTKEEPNWPLIPVRCSGFGFGRVASFKTKRFHTKSVEILPSEIWIWTRADMNAYKSALFLSPCFLFPYVVFHSLAKSWADAGVAIPAQWGTALSSCVCASPRSCLSEDSPILTSHSQLCDKLL